MTSSGIPKRAMQSMVHEDEMKARGAQFALVSAKHIEQIGDYVGRRRIADMNPTSLGDIYAIETSLGMELSEFGQRGKPIDPGQLAGISVDDLDLMEREELVEVANELGVQHDDLRRDEALRRRIRVTRQELQIA